MRLEDITKLLVPVAAAMAVAGCDAISSQQRVVTVQPHPEVHNEVRDAEPDAAVSAEPDAGIDAAVDADEELGPYDPDQCPRGKMSRLDEDNYLLILRKYHLPSGKNERRDKLLGCFGLTEFPRYILKHYDRYADKGHRVPPFEQAVERVTKTAPVAPPVPPAPTPQPAVPPAKTPVRESPVREPPVREAAPASVKETPAKIGSVDTLVIQYTNDSWRLGKNDLTGIRDYVGRHKGTKCYTVTGYATEGEARVRAATERAKGIKERLENFYNLKAKTRTHYKGTGLGRKAVVRAGCR